MHRVLVVEDEALIALSIEFLLESEGFEVMVCGHGADALAKIRSFAPDIVVTDYMMPVMNGAEFIARLRANPKTQPIPVIIVTAIPSEKLNGIPYDVLLRKPFTDENLLEAIRIALSRLPGQDSPP